MRASILKRAQRKRSRPRGNKTGNEHWMNFKVDWEGAFDWLDSKCNLLKEVVPYFSNCNDRGLAVEERGEEEENLRFAGKKQQIG